MFAETNRKQMPSYICFIVTVSMAGNALAITMTDICMAYAWVECTDKYYEMKH